MAEADNFVLRHNFNTCSGKNDRLHVEVNRSGIAFRKEGKRGVEARFQYSFDDVLGAVSVSDGELEIWICPFHGKSVLKRAGRRVEVLKLKPDGVDPDRKARDVVNEYQLTIARGARGLDISSKEQPSRRKFLVYVNPFSGTRLSEKILTENVRPVFSAAGVDMEIIHSTERGFVQRHARQHDMTGVERIVIVSGDGLITEAVNGIMGRSDWQAIMQLPFAIIPAGSGNALSASILHASKENYGVVEATYVALKGKSVPLDVMSMSRSKRRIYSILSMTWGMLADIDIGSEKYRRLGSARFTLAFMQQLYAPRRYPATLSFLPAEKVETRAEASSDVETVENLALGLQGPPPKTPKPAGRRSLRRSKRPASASASIDSRKSAASQESSASAASASAVSGVSSESLLGTYTLPKVSYLTATDSSPSDWVTVKGHFTSFSPMLVSHLGWDTYFLQPARLSDGYIHLLYIGGNASRSSLLSMFSQVGNNTGPLAAMSETPNYDIHYHRVKAFRIEMDPKDSFVAIDGEHVEGGSIQCEVHPSLMRVMAMPASCDV